MAVFFENGDRYNLLNSAVLDLLDLIAKENIKPLLEQLVRGHRGRRALGAGRGGALGGREVAMGAAALVEGGAGREGWLPWAGMHQCRPTGKARGMDGPHAVPPQVETYGHRFDDVAYVDTFRKLRSKYEQAPERAGDGHGPQQQLHAQQQHHHHQQGQGQQQHMMGAQGNGGGADGSGAGTPAGMALLGRRFVIGPGEEGVAGAAPGATPYQLLGRRRRRDERDLGE